MPDFGVGEHYVIVYSCSYSGGWDCHDGRWQLEVVNNTAPVCSGSSTRSCSIANGVGSQSGSCVSGVWSWGVCSVVSCNSGYHVSGSSCVVNSCSDGLLNQDETGVDCGGSVCPTCAAPVYLRTFYVSNNGDDTKDGLSPSTAWKTISKVNGRTFLPGDAVLFERGGVWRETLEVPSGGNSTNYLYFGSYGSGSNPQILGSKGATTWTNQGGNVWKSDVTFTNPRSLYPNYADIIFIISGNDSRFVS